MHIAFSNMKGKGNWAMENKGEIVIYKSNKGNLELIVKLENETVWLTQKQIAQLFKKGRTTITEHIRNVFKEGELEENSVCRNFRHTAADGKEYDAVYYNLDVVISVGYRVKSKEGTQFRIWATNVLRNHIVKGYTVKYDRINNLEQSIDLIKESFQLTKYRLEKFLINIGELARRDVVNAIDDKIDKLRNDYDSLVKTLKENKLLK